MTETASNAVPNGGFSGSLDSFTRRPEPPRPDFIMQPNSSGRALSASSDRPLSHAEQLIARGKELSTRTSQIGISLPEGTSLRSSIGGSEGTSLRSSIGGGSVKMPPVPQFAMSPAAGSSWAGWNSGNHAQSIYSSRSSQQEESKSAAVDRSARQDDVPLFGPDTSTRSEHGNLRELYENRYKLLRDDNQMLRENLRREQQAREEIARLMREECAELARRVKEANEAKNAMENKMEAELQDMKTLRITNRELSEACERRAVTIQELKSREQELHKRLEEAERGKSSSDEVISALEAACAQVKAQVEIEKNSKSEKAVELQTQVENLISHVEGLKTEAHQVQLVRNSEMQEVEHLRKAILDMQHQMEEQEGNIRSSLEAEFQERGRMLAQDHSEKMMKQINKASLLENDFAALKQENAELQETSDILRAKLVTVSEELQRRTEGEDSVNEGLKDKIRYLQGQLELQNAQIMDLGNSHEVVLSLQETNVNLIAQRNALESRLLELESKADQNAFQNQGPLPAVNNNISTLGLGGFQAPLSNPVSMPKGQPSSPYQGFPLPVVKATPVKTGSQNSPPQPHMQHQPQMAMMNGNVASSGPPKAQVGQPQMVQMPQPRSQSQMWSPMQQGLMHMQLQSQPVHQLPQHQSLTVNPQQQHRQAPQKAFHEMTANEVARAGFDPTSVIGC